MTIFKKSIGKISSNENFFLKKKKTSKTKETSNCPMSFDSLVVTDVE